MAFIHWVFGYDLFISYTRRDGLANYAAELRNGLRRKGLVSFVDSSELETGLSWRQSGRSSLLRSRKIVLLLGPSVPTSPGIKDELEFNASLDLKKKPISVVTFDASHSAVIADAEFLQLLTRNGVDLSEHVWIPEPLPSSEMRAPSEYVIDRICNDFRLRRQSSRRTRILSIAALVVAGFGAAAAWQSVLAQRRSVVAEASALWLSLGSLPDLNVDGRGALWRLSQGGTGLLEEFLRQGLSNAEMAEPVMAGSGVIARALVALSEDRRRLIRGALTTTDTASAKPDARGGLVRALMIEATGSAEGIGDVVQAIRVTSNPKALQALGNGLEELSTQLVPDQASSAMGPVLQALLATKDEDAQRALGAGFVALAGRLAPSQALRSFESVLEATTTGANLEVLGRCSAALVARLTPEQTPVALAMVLQGIEGTTDTLQQRFLGREDGAAGVLGGDNLFAFSIKRSTAEIVMRELSHDLQMLTERLTAAQAEGAADSLLRTLAESTELYQRQAIAQGLSVLPFELAPDQAWAAVEPALVAMDGGLESNGWALDRFGDSVSRLTPDQAAAVLEHVLRAIAKKIDTDQLDSLTIHLYKLCLRLRPAQAQAAIGAVLQVLGRVGSEPSPQYILHLGDSLEALATRLTPEQASAETGLVLRAVLRASSGDLAATPVAHMVQDALGQGLEALAGRLRPNQASALGEAVLKTILNTADMDILRGMARTLVALPIMFEPTQAAAVSEQILQIMDSSTDPEARQSAALRLAAVASKLGAGQASASVEPLLRTIMILRHSALDDCGDGLAVLAGQLTPQQAAALVIPIERLLMGTTDRSRQEALGKGLLTLAGRMTSEQALAAVEKLLPVIEATTTDEVMLHHLGGALAVLADKLDPDRAAQALSLVLQVMGSTTDVYRLTALGRSVSALRTNLTPEQASVVARTELQAVMSVSRQYELNERAAVFAESAQKVVSDDAFAVLVFEALKYPWVPVNPLREALRKRFQDTPAKESGFEALVNWGWVRFRGVVDFSRGSSTPAAIGEMVLKVRTTN